VANDLVERDEIAKARLNDGQQLLPVVFVEALRASSVKGPKRMFGCGPLNLDNLYTFVLAPHPNEGEQLHDTPETGWIRMADQHKKLLAGGEEDGQRSEVGINVALVDAVDGGDSKLSVWGREWWADHIPTTCTTS